MPASFMTLPFELREQILFPIVRTRATIELQYPLWADTDKSVFIPPVAQVCRELREEVFQCFYRANVFVWKIDSEPVRDSREWVARVRQRQLGENADFFLILFDLHAHVFVFVASLLQSDNRIGRTDGALNFPFGAM